MKKILALTIICILSVTFAGCGNKKENQNVPKTDGSGDVLDVMEYSENVSELISARNMEPVSKELGLGDLYEASGFDLYFGTDDEFELRNGECRNICISDVMIGDKMTKAGEKLDQDYWLCYDSGYNQGCYITKRNDRFYYLQMFFESDSEKVDHWYLSDRNDEEYINEVQTEYNVFQNTSEPWKKEYIKFVARERTSFGSALFSLINIDGDDIPELYISTGYTAGGDILCSYYDHSVISQYMWVFGLSYMEGRNLFMESGGHMDVYWNIIYSIVNGRFVVQNEGNFGAEDNTNVQWDADGNPVYDYYWNQKKVRSQKEYEKLLHDAFDDGQALSPYENAVYNAEKQCYTGDGIYNYQEIMEAIQNY